MGRGVWRIVTSIHDLSHKNSTQGSLDKGVTKPVGSDNRFFHGDLLYCADDPLLIYGRLSVDFDENSMKPLSLRFVTGEGSEGYCPCRLWRLGQDYVLGGSGRAECEIGLVGDYVACAVPNRESGAVSVSGADAQSLSDASSNGYCASLVAMIGTGIKSAFLNRWCCRWTSSASTCTSQFSLRAPRCSSLWLVNEKN